MPLKKSFVMYASWYENIRKQPPEVKAELLDAIFSFHLGEDFVFKNCVAEMAFSFMKQTFETNEKAYQEKCERLRENGKKGGRPRTEAAENQKKPNGFCKKQMVSGKTISGGDNDNDNENDNDKEEEKKTTSSSCGELKNYVFYLPLNDGSEHGITSDNLREWSALYPAVDVPGEIRKMRGWLSANTKKTKRGIGRFIQNWLSRSQDRAKAPRRPFCTTQAQVERQVAQDLSAALYNTTRGRSLFGDDNDCQQDAGPNGRGIQPETLTPAISHENGGLFGDS